MNQQPDHHPHPQLQPPGSFHIGHILRMEGKCFRHRCTIAQSFHDLIENGPNLGLIPHEISIKLFFIFHSKISFIGHGNKLDFSLERVSVIQILISVPIRGWTIKRCAKLKSKPRLIRDKGHSLGPLVSQNSHQHAFVRGTLDPTVQLQLHSIVSS